MSENFLFKLIQRNKSITNPINKSEVFMCSDIYLDYKKCKALSKLGKESFIYCHELRKLGQLCYINSEEDFEKVLARKFDEKREYVDYLKKEGSILYQVYINNPNTFNVLYTYNEEDYESTGNINRNIS